MVLDPASLEAWCARQGFVVDKPTMAERNALLQSVEEDLDRRIAHAEAWRQRTMGISANLEEVSRQIENVAGRLSPHAVRVYRRQELGVLAAIGYPLVLHREAMAPRRRGFLARFWRWVRG